MAQWKGQFTGLTHETRVQETERSLRKAVSAFSAATGPDRDLKAKAVRRLADRLLGIRLKAVRARLAALSESGTKTPHSGDYAHLRLIEAKLDSEGSSAILREFKFDEASDAGKVMVLLPFLAASILLGCNSSSGPTTIAIPDVTQTNALNLVASHSGKFVSGLTLRVQGHLDGTGYLSAASFPTQVLSGTINWRMHEDYFQTNCVLQYRPVGVRTGSLTIQYELR